MRQECAPPESVVVGGRGRPREGMAKREGLDRVWSYRYSGEALGTIGIVRRSGVEEDCTDDEWLSESDLVRANCESGGSERVQVRGHVRGVIRRSDDACIDNM